MSPQGKLPGLGTAARKISEKEYQDDVTKLAVLLHWDWHHVYPMMDRRGNWRTPTSGTLAKGWPDVLFVRRGWHVIVEFKGFDARGQATPFKPGQIECLDLMAEGPQHCAWVLRPTDDWDTTVSWFRFPWDAPKTFGYPTTLVESPPT